MVRGVLDGCSQPTQVACFVHGLLGSGRNWRSFARRLAEAAAQASGRGWRMVLVDQRNHGDSSRLRGFHAPHNMHSAATDLRGLFDSVLGGKAPDAIIGHSLGGKVVMSLLKQLQDEGGGEAGVQLPKQAWLLDSDPGPMPFSADRDVDTVLREVRGIPLPLASRAALTTAMQEKGFSQGLIQWLGSNLIPIDSHDPSKGMAWAFNLDGAAAMYASYRTTDLWPVLCKPPSGVGVHVVVAEQSDRFTPSMMQRLKGAEAKSRGAAGVGQQVEGCTTGHVLEKAGHWLHVDNPGGLVRLMCPYFSE